MEVAELELEDRAARARLNTLLAPLVLDADTAARLLGVFNQELERGLESGLKESSLLCENTFVPELLSGREAGRVLALDLGGTNFRVMGLELAGGRVAGETVQHYTVPEQVRLGPGSELFAFLASCIQQFLAEQPEFQALPTIPLGFTFSFPLSQQALDKGLLVNWTKSFNCPGVVGQDVVALLRAALSKAGVTNVCVVAVLNDTTGTLVAGAAQDPACCLGLILGTGTNASYLEQSERVVRWGDCDPPQPGSQVIIDPEFGALGDNGCVDFIKTEWDRAVDRGSLLPGSFTYEKYFAGKYLGELVRLVFLSCCAELGEETPLGLARPDSLPTSAVSALVAGRDPELPAPLPPALLAVLTHVARLLSERAALLVAVPVAGLLSRVSHRARAVVAVTGSLYRLHPTLASRLAHHSARLTSVPHTYQLCQDGSGRGAGLIAAIATRLHTEGSAL